MFNKIKIKKFINKSIKQANQQIWEENEFNKRFEVFIGKTEFVKLPNKKLNAIVEFLYMDKSGMDFEVHKLEYKDPLFQSNLFSQTQKFVDKCKSNLPPVEVK